MNLHNARFPGGAIRCQLKDAWQAHVHPEEMDCCLGRHGFQITDLVRADELQARYAGDDRVLSDESLYVLAAERADRAR